jgi:hypothetical protein
MHIKYIWQAYRIKATYKGGRRTLRCLETGSHLQVELTKTTGHNYCSLLTSVPDPGNFGTDPDHRIYSRKTDPDTYKYLWTFGVIKVILVLKCKKILKCILPCQKFNFVKKIAWQKCRDVSVTFCNTKFREKCKMF